MPESVLTVLVTRAANVQSALWLPGSVTVQLVLVVVAVVQVAPESKDTCSISLALKPVLMVPVTVRLAAPSLVIKSVAELPES